MRKVPAIEQKPNPKEKLERIPGKANHPGKSIRPKIIEISQALDRRVGGDEQTLVSVHGRGEEAPFLNTRMHTSISVLYVYIMIRKDVCMHAYMKVEAGLTLLMKVEMETMSTSSIPRCPPQRSRLAQGAKRFPPPTVPPLRPQHRWGNQSVLLLHDAAAVDAPVSGWAE